MLDRERGRAPLAPPEIAAEAGPGQRWPIGVGPRGFWLLAAGLLWIIPAWLDRRTLIALLVWDALVLACWLIDLRRLPPPHRLRVRRVWHGALGLATPQQVSLFLHNGGAQPIDAALVDFVSTDLRRDPAEGAVTVAAGREARLDYDVRPAERGDTTMGPVLIRYRSAWNIATRWATAPVSQTVRVYPNLREAETQALILVRTRQTAIERRRARERGVGREFDSLREYQDGDEPRDICWTATARRGHLVTRRYQPERSQAVWILIDTGRLLRARVQAHSKLDYGVNSALALAQVAMLSGDRVGLLAYGRRPQQRVAPGRGGAHLRTLVEALAAVRAETVEADHTAAAGAVLALQKRRALIVWLTDVPETAGVPEVIESSRRMTPRHVVMLGLTREPELAALAEARASTEEEMYRVMAAQQMNERREELLHGLRERGILTLELPPGELGAGLVDRYLSVKARSLL